VGGRYFSQRNKLWFRVWNQTAAGTQTWNESGSASVLVGDIDCSGSNNNDRLITGAPPLLGRWGNSWRKYNDIKGVLGRELEFSHNLIHPGKHTEQAELCYEPMIHGGIPQSLEFFYNSRFSSLAGRHILASIDDKRGKCCCGLEILL
jgi:hypothetical protein